MGDWERCADCKILKHKSERMKNRRICKICSASRNRISRRMRQKIDPFKEKSKEAILRLKHRSRRLNIPFNLDLEFIMNLLKNNIKCSCCGCLLIYNYNTKIERNPRGITIDRFIPRLGYTKNNIFVLCFRCNSLKRDATSKELRRIADWIDHHNECFLSFIDQVDIPEV